MNFPAFILELYDTWSGKGFQTRNKSFSLNDNMLKKFDF